jgi:hypothetical protein
MGDVRLTLREIDIKTTDGVWCGTATAEGNNAAWTCECDRTLVGRAYFQFGHQCHTVCPACGTRYRVVGDERKRAIRVVKEADGWRGVPVEGHGASVTSLTP